MRDKLDWQNPMMIGKNKLRGHLETPSFQNMDELSNYLSDDVFGVHTLQQGVWPNRICLNGMWKFHLSPNVIDRALDFYKPEVSVDHWDDIEVPGVWQLQGYEELDKPYYLAFDYPPAIGKKNIPNIKEELNPVGSYRREIHLTKEQLENNTRVFLHFGAVKSAFYLWMNGKEVGYSQGSMTPAEFDITDYVVEGLNIVATQVYRYSDGSYLEDQDMWFLSGMYRDVHIVFEPSTYLEDIYTTTSLKEEAWELKTEILICNATNIANPLKLEIHFEGELVAEARLVADVFEKQRMTLSALVQKPKLWSAEKPNLYPLVVVLKDPFNKVIQVKHQLIGFREVSIVDGIFLLNKQPIKLHGINRHEFHQDTGYYVPEEVILQDLIEMKRLNINAIRTSHYPNSPYFYHLCDKLGFYVIDEADIETHGIRRKGIPGHKPIWKDAVIDRIERMVLRDRNHPCILMWSLGNEAGFGPNFIEMKKAAKALDGSRYIHYEGDTKLKVSDVFSRMYASPEFVHLTGQKKDLTISLTEKLMNYFAQDNKAYKAIDYSDKPVMYCEFAHSMENSLGNLKDHVDGWYSYPNWLGGFIWDYVDQSIHKVVDGEDQWLYGGDFGEEVSHGYYNANGIVASNRRLHPSAYEVKKVYQYIQIDPVNIESGILNITNRHLFTDLKEYLWLYELLEDGAVIDQGEIELFSIGPLDKKEVKVPFDSFNKEPGIYYHLNVYCVLREDTSFENAGYIMAMEQMTFETQGTRLTTEGSMIPLNVQEKQLKIEVSSIEFSATISKTSGDIISFRIMDQEILRKPMGLNLWRPETDNDRGLSNFKPWLRPYVMDYTYKKAMNNYKVAKYEIQDMHHKVEIILYRKVKGFKDYVVTTYTFDGEGNIEVGLKGMPKKELVRFGTTLGIDKSWSSYMYFGKGPFENYCDRGYGSPMGIYEGNMYSFIHQYMRPQENGNREKVHWFIAENENQIGIMVEDTSGKGMNISAWPYTQEELDSKEHIHELEEAEYITLNIDGMQKGVGGDYPGMLTLMDKYKLKAKEEVSYSFKLLRV